MIDVSRFLLLDFDKVINNPLPLFSSWQKIQIATSSCLTMPWLSFSFLFSDNYTMAFLALLFENSHPFSSSRFLNFYHFIKKNIIFSSIAIWTTAFHKLHMWILLSLGFSKHVFESFTQPAIWSHTSLDSWLNPNHLASKLFLWVYLFVCLFGFFFFFLNNYHH